MRIAFGRTVFEKSPFLTRYVFFFQIVETGSKEPEHNMGPTVPWSDKR
jgi:hypothetical protein